jgi:hypothetical protein
MIEEMLGKPMPGQDMFALLLARYLWPFSL